MSAQFPKVKKEKIEKPAPAGSAAPQKEKEKEKGEKRKVKSETEQKSQKGNIKEPAAKVKKQEELPQEELEKVISSVDAVQDELALVEHDLQLQVAKLEAAQQSRRLPLYEKRDALLQKIPGFWRSMLINHPMISDCLEQVDTEILDSLISLRVVDFYNEPRDYTDKKTKKTSKQPANGFRITMEVADDDANVKAGKITTEIAILALPPTPKSEVKEEEENEDEEDDSNEIIITQTPTSAFRNPKFAEKNPESFFVTWFDNNKDKFELRSLGEILRDMYRNPLPDEEEEEGGEEAPFQEDDGADEE